MQSYICFVIVIQLPNLKVQPLLENKIFFLIYVNFDKKYCTVYFFFFFYIYIYIFFFLFYFLAILEKKLALAKYDIIFFFPLASSLGQ